jgi:cyclophilin family peptidyl-prolyl cis-trans isomerase
MIQGGDMMGAGVGDPGYKFATEVDPSLKHEVGTLAMANAGPNTNGSQFYITESAPTHLDGGYNIFGRCKEVELIKRIARVPKDPANASKPATPVLMKRIVIHR